MDVKVIYGKVRKCGYRKEGGVYLDAGSDAGPNGTLPMFVRLNPPVPYPVKLHRGPRLVDGDPILARMPMDSWWYGASRETEDQKKTDKWEEGVFGMTTIARLKGGVCANCQAAEEALGFLVGRVAWDNRLVSLLRDMTIAEVHNIPGLAGHFDGLRREFKAYIETKRVDHLVLAQAEIWRLASKVPTNKREEVIPTLMRMLAVMDLAPDAAYMNARFMERRTV